ncbi:TIGR00366 family protein [Brevibacillus daliensis]|uniref:TIGR00366 family protein n=1 Tax=Brevibacillus daliensis TaxID=2892995 RepID=UPI001E4B12D3|nr:TIGR00366 family protein [Brevibacillus daliensis]
MANLSPDAKIPVSPQQNKNVKLSLSERTADLYSKYFPDSMIFALLLTLISMVLALLLTDSGPMQVIDHWFKGFPWMFTFAFQLILTYAAALVIVESPAVGKRIEKIARLVKTPSAAYVSTALVGGFSSLLGWYIGPVVTATYARAIGRTNDSVDYRLLTAIAYSSFVVWVGGLSGTIPLFVATQGPLTDLLGGLIPLDQTIFTVMNMVTMITTVFVIAIIFYFIGKNKKVVVPYKDLLLEKEEESKPASSQQAATGTSEWRTFADKINHSRPILFVVGLIGVVYCFYYFIANGYKGLNLNTIAFLIMFLGFMIKNNALEYAKAFGKHMAASTSIAVQFPLYGAIASLLTGTGLAEVFSQWVVTISTTGTFPMLTFLMEGLIHLFIPSAGSLFTATGPAFIPAAVELGVDIPRAVMAMNLGEAWTTLIQPFWALLFMPIMAVGTKLSVRDFLGYCLPILIVVGIMWIIGVTFLPM